VTTARTWAVVALALAAGATAAVVALTSDHRDARIVWAIFGPAVLLSFVGTGLYAWRRRPESRIGALMVLLGFAWFLFTLESSNSPLVHTSSLVTGGLWGGVFLHIGMSFPSGRLASARDRAIVIAGYVIFPLAFVPSLLFAGEHALDCACPEHLLLLQPDDDLALAGRVFGALLYVGLFVIVLARAIPRWRGAAPEERVQLAPVYACALLTFLLVTIAQAGVGDAAWWPAFVSTALLPFAFLGSLLRSHVSHLDAELRESLEELRASRARVVQAGDAERRRLERDLHDGAQSRLVALALTLRSARKRAEGNDELAGLLDRSIEELQLGLQELRELARGIHPAVLSDRGLDTALETLARRAPVPVELQRMSGGRLPEAVELVAYFVVAEALTNVAKYAHASSAVVRVVQDDEMLAVYVSDDGVGGADAAGGSGLRGLVDRVEALDGSLRIASPSGGGTTVHATIPLEGHTGRNVGPAEPLPA